MAVSSNKVSSGSSISLGGHVKYSFNMIDNYIYLHHTDTLIMLPTYPETISDHMGASFSPATPLGRSAPIYSYSNSGPRDITFSFKLHREMMEEINYGNSSASVAMGDDYTDTMIKQIQAVALPEYSSGSKLINPPLVSVRIGDDIFIKGIVNGGVTATYDLPILTDINGNNKYAMVSIQFTVSEVEPYTASQVMSCGSFRGISTSLEKRVYKTYSSGKALKKVTI